MVAIPLGRGLPVEHQLCLTQGKVSQTGSSGTKDEVVRYMKANNLMQNKYIFPSETFVATLALPSTPLPPLHWMKFLTAITNGSSRPFGPALCLLFRVLLLSCLQSASGPEERERARRPRTPLFYSILHYFTQLLTILLNSSIFYSILE